MSKREQQKRRRLGVAEFDQILEATMNRRRGESGLTPEDVAADLGLTEADFAEAERWDAEHREELADQDPAKALGKKQG
jgi:hypothetical protein